MVIREVYKISPPLPFIKYDDAPNINPTTPRFTTTWHPVEAGQGGTRVAACCKTVITFLPSVS